MVERVFIGDMILKTNVDNRGAGINVLDQVKRTGKRTVYAGLFVLRFASAKRSGRIPLLAPLINRLPEQHHLLFGNMRSNGTGSAEDESSVFLSNRNPLP